MDNSHRNTNISETYRLPTADEYAWQEPPVSRSDGWAAKAARLVSGALHPFLVPVYSIAVFMFGGTMIAAAPVRLKWFFSLMIVLVALVIPALSIGLLRALRIISDFSMKRRQDRTIPIAIVALSYGLCIVMVTDIMWGFMIRKFLIAAFCCAVSALAITPFWKISLHMIAAGGATAMFIVLNIAGIGSMFWPMVAAILLSGALGSSRLYLGSNSPAQVGAGYLLGLTLSAATMLLIH